MEILKMNLSSKTEPLLEFKLLLEQADAEGLATWGRGYARLFSDRAGVLFCPKFFSESSPTIEYLRLAILAFDTAWVDFLNVQLVVASPSFTDQMNPRLGSKAELAEREFGYLLNRAQSVICTELRAINREAFRFLLLCHPGVVVSVSDWLEKSRHNQVWKCYYSELACFFIDKLNTLFSSPEANSRDKLFNQLISCVKSPILDFLEGFVFADYSDSKGSAKLSILKNRYEILRSDLITSFDLREDQYVPQKFGSGATWLPAFDDEICSALVMLKAVEGSEQFFKDLRPRLIEEIRKVNPEITSGVEVSNGDKLLEFSHLQKEEELRQLSLGIVNAISSGNVPLDRLSEVVVGLVKNHRLYLREYWKRMVELQSDLLRLRALKASLPKARIWNPKKRSELFSQWVAICGDLAGVEARIQSQISTFEEQQEKVDSYLCNFVAGEIGKNLEIGTYSEPRIFNKIPVSTVEQFKLKLREIFEQFETKRLDITRAELPRRLVSDDSGIARKARTVISSGAVLALPSAVRPETQVQLPPQRYFETVAGLIAELFVKIEGLSRGFAGNSQDVTEQLELSILSFELAWDWVLGAIENPYGYRDELERLLSALYPRVISRQVAKAFYVRGTGEKAEEILHLLILSKPELVFNISELRDVMDSSCSKAQDYLLSLANLIVRRSTNLSSQQKLELFEAVCCLAKSPYRGFDSQGDYDLNSDVDTEYGISTKQGRLIFGNYRRELLRIWVERKNTKFSGTVDQPGWLYANLLETMNRIAPKEWVGVFDAILQEEFREAVTEVLAVDVGPNEGLSATSLNNCEVNSLNDFREKTAAIAAMRFAVKNIAEGKNL